MVTILLLLIWLTLHSMGALGFQAASARITSRSSSASSSFSSSALLQASVPSPSSTTTSENITTTTTLIPRSEIRSLFHLLADDAILYDPSRGTCCRSRCSGCTYLDPWSGNFLFEEYIASSTLDDNCLDENGEYVGGWIAPYVTINFGERAHTSTWGRTLFLTMMEGEKPPRKEVERERLESLLGVATTSDVGSLSSNIVSSLALQSLWNILSPSVGYPKLSKVDITQAIKGMEGSDYSMGGAVNFATFEKSIIIAAERIVNGHLDDSNDFVNAGSMMDYDSMTKEELLEECTTRGMRTSFPKIKRIIIEELRFYDANGRQGKRHPVKNTLS